MRGLLRLKSQLKVNHSRLAQQASGFTLIELLVGMVISSIILSSLLAFMVNVLDTERKEQAKSNSEQELQSALDYIARDLQQAIYIYDANGLNNNSNTSTPTSSGIRNQIPPEQPVSNCDKNNTNTVCTPVLVFWKRSPLKQADVPGCTGNSIDYTVCRDHFLYSLVGYYLLTDKNPNSSSPWSSAARIGRFEIRNGVRSSSGTITRTETTSASGTSVTNSVKYLLAPDKGFMPFNPSLAANLPSAMNLWQKNAAANENYSGGNFAILVDYIDQSTNNQIPAPNATTAANCQNVLQLPTAQQVPDYTASNFPSELKTGSFYACVNNSSPPLAQVFLRGNALARINKGATYNTKQSGYFPTESVQVKGRGLLGN